MLTANSKNGHYSVSWQPWARCRHVPDPIAVSTRVSRSALSSAASMSAEDEGEEGAYTTCWVTAQRKKDGAMLVRLPRYTDASKILEASTTLV